MAHHDIIDNWQEKPGEHIDRILSSTTAGTRCRPSVYSLCVLPLAARS